MSSSFAISWVLSSFSGYGIYGLQILLQYLRRGGDPNAFILTNKPVGVMLPPLEQEKIASCLGLADKISAVLKQNPKELLRFNHPVLHGCSSNFSGFLGQDRVWGAPNVGCAAIEHLFITDHGRRIAKNYDMFIAISRWNADFLKSLDVGSVHLCYQGIDPTLFHPAPGSGLYRNRFVVFSGGKFEYRKAQDLVVAAFKRFHATHSDALLVACWQALAKPDAEAFSKAGLVDGIPEERADKGGLQITPWLLKQGLPPGSFVDLPFTHNMLMPMVLRDCDMAVFPNRCEGGTNLVAMEAMACGVPTYVSYNTGQKDLVDLIGCEAFRTQREVRPSMAMATVQDWGESDVDEIVMAMETVYNAREEARRKASSVASRVASDWAWSGLNDRLLDVVEAPVVRT